jgi:Phage capsid family
MVAPTVSKRSDAMTIAQMLGAAERQFELARQSGEFVSLVRVLLQAKGDLWSARQIVEQQGRVSPSVRDLLDSDQALTKIRRGNGPKWNPRGDRGSVGDAWISQKAAASALSLADNSAFATYELLVSGFINALSSQSVFEQMRPAMRAVPIGRTVGAVSVAAAGFTVGEGSAKQVSRLSLTSGALEPQKSHALVAVSNELLKHGGREVEALITRELIHAASLAVDSGFLATLLSGVSVGTSSGSTAEAVRADLAVLLAAVPTDQTSKLFILTSPLVCKMWAAMGATATNGRPAFPQMTPQGGSILGITVIASDAVTAGQVVLVDATGIAAGSDTITLNTMAEGTIMPDSAPDSPQVAGTNVVSLWQSDLSAILAERWWTCEKLLSTAVAAVSNSNSYQQGFSPP